ncbi:hypothetical protein D3C76_1875200 [compost metagenome]
MPGERKDEHHGRRAGGHETALGEGAADGERNHCGPVRAHELDGPNDQNLFESAAQ